ncbi:uncharacterized protein LOC132607756 [Lycium barbarum]|uniref:uncharacterized protein LOC132607756 n=1 Tax=Lycium barbarum TaxID=112863 RepID=UPI00293E3BD8|nr:uncharacterized protein LOC132607756 [Lycium barbarum]
MEPFQNANKIHQYRRRIGMPYANSNCNGKICFFVNDNIDMEILEDTAHQVTLKLHFQELDKTMIVTLVYEKCDALERLSLWDIMYCLADGMTTPWLIGGDFNVILNEEEKIGGLPVLPQEYEDFAFCINSCKLAEISFKGNPFTWLNGKADQECIFKRLDRILSNEQFQDWFGHLEVDHLSRTGFKEIVKNNWLAEDGNDVFISFKQKVKQVKTALSVWSKQTFGDIFNQLNIREDIVKIKEQLFEEAPSETNRMILQRAQAEMKKYLHYEEEFWKQNAGFTHFAEGDKNTRFFHNALFLNYVPEMLSQEDNELMCATPTILMKSNMLCLNYQGIVTDKVLPSLISANQSGFVKGRNIIENVLLAQEIVSDIRLRGKPANLVIMLDMTKAYDRSHGFFHSTRGVKQGDSLSPALFIQSAEVLTRALSALFEDHKFKGLKYEEISGQLINKGKRSFYMYSKVTKNLVQQVETITGFSRGSFPFVYLGCPITHARKRKADYNDLLKKVRDKLHAWKGKLLSPGGKAMLINSVLQSIPIHLLSAIKPPKCVIKDIHKIFARSFWSSNEDVKKRHWSAWLNMCYPKHEGGLGFRSIFDVSKAQCAKLWWRFRTVYSLWSNFMWIKYYKKQYPQNVQWKGGSQVWKMMLEARDNIEQEIWWETRSGTTNIWFHNWTRVEHVKELMNGGMWDIVKLEQCFPEEIVDHIMAELEIKENSQEWDKPWWMMTSTGEFSVASAWEMLRQKSHSSDIYKDMWIKGLPFKISFFLWRLWKFKIPVDEVLTSIGQASGVKMVAGPMSLKVETCLQSSASHNIVAFVKVEEYNFAWRGGISVSHAHSHAESLQLFSFKTQQTCKDSTIVLKLNCRSPNIDNCLLMFSFKKIDLQDTQYLDVQNTTTKFQDCDLKVKLPQVKVIKQYPDVGTTISELQDTIA